MVLIILQSQKILSKKIGFFIKQFDIESNIDGKEYDFKYEDVYDVSEHFKLEFKNAGVMRNGKIYYRLKEKEKIMNEAIESTTLKRVDFDDEEDLKLIMNKH